MSLLGSATRPRPTKGIAQADQAAMPGVVYVPLENRSTWTMDWLPQESKALAIATFYAGVRVLAETFAMLPLFVYQRREDGGRDRSPDHPLYRVLHDEPNPEMSSFTWRELVMQNLVTWGNHYSEIVKDGNGRMQLWPLRPDRMEVAWNPDSTRRYTYTRGTGERKKMEPGSVFHVPGMGWDGLKGYSLLELHRRTFRLHDAARDYAENTFNNNAQPAVVLKHPKNLSEGAIQRLAGQMDDLRGSGNAGKTVLLEEGLDFGTVGIPPKDAQYLEARVFQKREIATILRIQLHKLNDLEHATFSNIEEQNQEFIQDTMQPWFARFEGESNRQLLPERERGEYYVKFLISGYLRGNSKDRAEALQIRRQNGTLNADEWREIEDENPLDNGAGKDYWMPVNMTPVAGSDAAPPAVDVVDGEAPGPRLVASKSAQAVELRCPSCKKLLLKRAMPGSSGECSRCKTEVAV